MNHTHEYGEGYLLTDAKGSIRIFICKHCVYVSIVDIERK